MTVIVYETTNLINDKIYIGVRDLSNESKKYLGSGLALKRAIAKYGFENFSRKTLFEFDNPEEAFAKEAEIVDEKFIKRSDTYNIAAGGRGGNTSSGRTLTDEHKAKLSKALRGRKLSEEHKAKISKGNMGRITIGFKGLSHSDETKAKMSISAKNRAKVECPNCSKKISKNVANRWHFDNCKNKKDLTGALL